MAAMSKRIQVWFPEDVLNQINARGRDFSDPIRESLSRYFALIDDSRKGLQGKFTKEELGLLIDISNGTIFEARSLRGLLCNAQDCAPDGTWEKWGADENVLLDKLEALTLTDHAALVDACERWWHRIGEDEQLSVEDLL